MYVVLEGVDTTGKSTQIELLKMIYKNAVFTKEPSDSAFGKEVRRLALHGNLSNATQAMLFLADRAQHTRDLLLPNEDKLIISDRSFISGVAYSKLPLDLMLKINLELSLKPNLVVILETSRDILNERLSVKECDDIEKNGISYLLKVQENILLIAQNLDIKYLRIPCNLTKEQILKQIVEVLDEMLNM